MPNHPRKTLHYLFDPLCGWCYGASAALTALAHGAGIHLHLMPSGLFANAGAHPMDARFAAYAWLNDQRIQQLTGQPFSEAYRDKVLAHRQQMFDSGPATLALSATAQTAPERELDALRAIQKARYVGGLDVTDSSTLSDVLQELGLQDAAKLQREPSAGLMAFNRRRVEESQRLMQTVGAQGVPAFVLEANDQLRLLPSSSAFSHPADFAQAIAAA